MLSIVKIKRKIGYSLTRKILGNPKSQIILNKNEIFEDEKEPDYGELLKENLKDNYNIKHKRNSIFLCKTIFNDLSENSFLLKNFKTKNALLFGNLILKISENTKKTNEWVENVTNKKKETLIFFIHLNSFFIRTQKKEIIPWFLKENQKKSLLCLLSNNNINIFCIRNKMNNKLVKNSENSSTN